MKKKVVFMLLCVLVLSCAFAGKASLKFQVSPYSLQSVSATGGKFVSTYGFGFKGGFRYNVWNNLTAGLDLGLSEYKYKELKTEYNVVSLRVIAGYFHDFSSKFYGEAELGLGIDRREISSAHMNTFGMNGYLGCGLKLSDEFSVNGGVDIGLAFQSGKKTKSTDFSFSTRLGIQTAL